MNEGDRITKGQFLLQIDPKTLRSRVDSGSASLQANIQTLEQMRQAIETARAQLVQAQQNLARQQDLWKQQLTTREALEKAENDLKVAQSGLQEREKTLKPQESRIAQERAGLDSAQYDLSKVRIVSPIDGIVTARNIQEGEMVMIGTMNNAGTVLMTLADMSVIQAEVEVDETNIPNVQLGQQAKITIDAIPDKSFRGHVAEIGNSPIQAAAGSTGDPGDQLQGQGDDRRADSGSAARLHLHRRHHHRDPQGGRRGADSGGGGSRADLRRRRTGREGAEARQEAACGRCGRGRGGGGDRTEARPDAQGDRRRVRGARRQGGVRPDQDGHRRRQVLRGAQRPQVGRPGDHRSVQLGARHGGRRSGQGGQRRRRSRT